MCLHVDVFVPRGMTARISLQFSAVMIGRLRFGSKLILRTLLALPGALEGIVWQFGILFSSTKFLSMELMVNNWGSTIHMKELWESSQFHGHQLDSSCRLEAMIRYSTLWLCGDH